MQWCGTGSIIVTSLPLLTMIRFFKKHNFAKQYSIKICCSQRMCFPLFSRNSRSFRICAIKVKICKSKIRVYIIKSHWICIKLITWISSRDCLSSCCVWTELFVEVLGSFGDRTFGVNWKLRSNSTFSYFISALNSDRFTMSFRQKGFKMHKFSGEFYQSITFSVLPVAKAVEWYQYGISVWNYCRENASQSAQWHLDTIYFPHNTNKAHPFPLCTTHHGWK